MEPLVGMMLIHQNSSVCELVLRPTRYLRCSSPTIHDESSIYQPLRQNKTGQDPCPEKDSQTVQASVASPVCEFLLGSNSRPLVL